ncbi:MULTISPECIES: START domain-containing protein [Acinetobacter]|jgi:START domain.|uniref:START domain-containing protein n=1 Tax=Acinetobacter TaxID=469 RepID=UPI0015D40BA6|nr:MULTISPECIES: START domain-containing protein [Acinetobacter]MCL6234457.1 START domain-containing protein [Acinetobacter amyesii]MCL6239201.1 START domain-containing protein [Acinetobacter amyesii]MCL6241647.1 START domain-containing protein [Acinetobacter amyesii]MCL6244606.1 START domain-containing protein [Acinetobacter amyesii]
MKKVIFMACAVAFTAAVQAKTMDNAKLTINKNNIKVWTYQNAQNPVFQYKAETSFDVPIEKAVSLILDVENAVNWVPYMGSVKVLSRDDQKGEFSLYMVLDFPFPLKDRDLVVQGKMRKDAQGIISIQNKAVKKGYPINPNYVRLTDYEGDWTFQRLGNQKVKVSTYGYANPEGSIPLSFVNMFVQQQPYQMLQKMKVQLGKSKTVATFPEILK